MSKPAALLAPILYCTKAAVEGHSSLYVPNLIGTPDGLRRQLEFARELGVRAVLVAPMLVGLPAFQELVHRVERAALIGPV